MIQIIKKEFNKKKFNLVVAIPVLHNPEDIQHLYYSFKKSKLNNTLLCFVDDSKTNEVILEIYKYFKKNFIIFKGKKRKNGRNFAVDNTFRWILKNIDTKLIAEFDSDNSYRFIDLKKGVKKIYNNFDMAIGSKYLKKSKIVNRTFIRNFFSLIPSLICRYLFKKAILDYTNAQRIYKISFYKKILKKKITLDSPVENLNIVLFAISIGGKIAEYDSWYIGNQKSHWHSNFFSFLKQTYKTLKIISYYFLINTTRKH
jgi:hypothetical protein